MSEPAGRRRRRRLDIPLFGIVLLVIAVAVAAFAGRRGDHNDEQGVTAVDAGTRTVAVRLADMRMEPSRIAVPMGVHLVLQVTNVDDMEHDLYIDGGPRTPLLPHDRSARLDLGPVTKTLHGWCTVPGHKAAGMTMMIAVRGGAPAPASTGSRTAKSYDATLGPAPDSRVHRVTFIIVDKRVEVAPGVQQTLWTYNGTAPGPILHGHVGDVFIVKIVNHGDMAHGIDFHAGSLAPDAPMRPIPPGASLTYRFTATYSGAWLYHCSTMPMSLHIANGMYGAVIIDPPDLDPVAEQLVLVQSELYLGPQGGIASEAKIDARKPDAVVFNGKVDQYQHTPIRVHAGERIRVWVVDAGPEFGTSFHVVGTQFDTVFNEGGYLIRAGNPEHGAAQTLDLASGQGGFAEFTLLAPGRYPFVDHAMVDAGHGAEGVLVAR